MSINFGQDKTKGGPRLDTSTTPSEDEEEENAPLRLCISCDLGLGQSDGKCSDIFEVFDEFLEGDRRGLIGRGVPEGILRVVEER